MISVIIPTCHRNDLLSLCLDRLAPGQQSLSFENYEVIVSDDGSSSTANSLIAEKYPWVSWVEGPRRGPAANRNHGARQAGGEWLVFTDDDCLPDAHWLEAYVSAIEKMPEVKVFEGRTYVDRPRRRLDEESPVNETGGYLWSCNFAIQKKLFLEIGGFDEQFPYAAMEDVDLFYRIRAKKIKSEFLKEASVCHPWRRRYLKDWKVKIYHTESLLYFLNKHPSEKTRLDSRYFFRAFLLNIYRKFAPGLFKYRLKGSLYSLMENFMMLRSALVLLFKRN